MKKLTLALFTCLSFIVFTSCTTEDIDDTSTILGEWTLTSWAVDTPIDLNNDGTPQLEFSPGCLTDSTINFMDASNATVFYSSEVTYNTRMENGKVIFMTSCSTDSDRMPTIVNYTINNNSVMIDIEGEVMVLTLSGNTLTMTVPNGFIAKDIDTFETTVSQDVTYTFTR
jgi:hypothetical protein